MKGWKKDNGTWSWTPEIVLEYESDEPLLRDQQVADILGEAEQLKEIFKQIIEGPPKAPQAKVEPEKKLVLPPTNPSVLKDAPGIKPPATAPAPAQDAPKTAEAAPAPQKPAEAPKATAAPPARPAAKAEGPKTLDGFDGEKIAAYDRNKPGFVCCPQCGSTDVTHDKKPPKKGTYQACWDCRIWLNAADGAVKPMDTQEAQ